jgi:hypothetical protein
MVSVVFQKRSLPLLWVTRKVKKGHFPEALHIELITAVKAHGSYLWMVYLGALAVQQGWHKIIHRTDRCDISLFQLGKRWFRYVLRQGMPLPDFCLILTVR